MLFSQGIRLEDLGVPTTDGSAVQDRRPEDLAAVRQELLPVPRYPDPLLAGLIHWRRCSASPSAWAKRTPMPSMTRSPSGWSATTIARAPCSRRFNLEVISTTDAALDDLKMAPDDPR